MRPDAEQSSYVMKDVQDQPEAKYVLFLDIGKVPSTLLVDGVRWTEDDQFIGVGLEGYREGTETTAATTVVRFDADITWSLVAMSHVERLNKTQTREHYLAGLSSQLRMDVRAARLVKAAKIEAQHDESGAEAFDEYMRRQLGEDGGEKL